LQLRIPRLRWRRTLRIAAMIRIFRDSSIQVSGK
jgi:hypothetical protein